MPTTILDEKHQWTAFEGLLVNLVITRGGYPELKFSDRLFAVAEMLEVLDKHGLAARKKEENAKTIPNLSAS